MPKLKRTRKAANLGDHAIKVLTFWSILDKYLTRISQQKQKTALSTVAEEDQVCFFKSVFCISNFDSKIKFSLTLHNISVILLTLTGAYPLPSSYSSPPLPLLMISQQWAKSFCRILIFCLSFFDNPPSDIFIISLCAAMSAALLLGARSTNWKDLYCSPWPQTFRPCFYIVVQATS